MNLRLRKSQIPPHLLKFFRPVGHKPKDLVDTPHMLAEALREDGWYYRADIVWSKKSPMPESVRDRPTRAHEQVFLLTKEGRYFYDQEAERCAQVSAPHAAGNRTKGQPPGCGSAITGWRSERVSSTVYDYHPAGRNLWSWWADIPPSPDSVGHFALMPLALAARCLRLGTSAKGCCPACGAAWRRVVAKGELQNPRGATPDGGQSQWRGDARRDPSARSDVALAGAYYPKTTTGWRPGCACGPHEPIGCLCLDPFAGAGTTGIAARNLGRRFLGVELSPKYSELARRRIGAAAPLLDHHDKLQAAPRQRDLFEEPSC